VLAAHTHKHINIYIHTHTYINTQAIGRGCTISFHLPGDFMMAGLEEEEEEGKREEEEKADLGVLVFDRDSVSTTSSSSSRRHDKSGKSTTARWRQRGASSTPPPLPLSNMSAASPGSSDGGGGGGRRRRRGGSKTAAPLPASLGARPNPPPLTAAATATSVATTTVALSALTARQRLVWIVDDQFINFKIISRTLSRFATIWDSNNSSSGKRNGEGSRFENDSHHHRKEDSSRVSDGAGGDGGQLKLTFEHFSNGEGLLSRLHVNVGNGEEVVGETTSKAKQSHPQHSLQRVHHRGYHHHSLSVVLPDIIVIDQHMGVGQIIGTDVVQLLRRHHIVSIGYR